MARETLQQKDKRTQSKPKTPGATQRSRTGESTQPSQSAQAARPGAGDRQAQIQTSRDESIGGGQGRTSRAPSQRAESPSVSQPTSGIISQGTGSVRRGGTANPFELMQRMSDDMDRLFQQFGFGRSALGLGPILGSSLGIGAGEGRQQFSGEQSLWAPQVETARRGDRFVIRADLPGIEKDDIRVHVDDDVVAISGERRSHQHEERDGLFRSERSYGSFYRAIPLPEGVSGDQCQARFIDGVLEISLPAPKSEQRQPRQIEIR